MLLVWSYILEMFCDYFLPKDKIPKKDNISKKLYRKKHSEIY